MKVSMLYREHMYYWLYLHLSITLVCNVLIIRYVCTIVCRFCLYCRVCLYYKVVPTIAYVCTIGLFQILVFCMLSLQYMSVLSIDYCLSIQSSGSSNKTLHVEILLSCQKQGVTFSSCRFLCQSAVLKIDIIKVPNYFQNFTHRKG